MTAIFQCIFNVCDLVTKSWCTLYLGDIYSDISHFLSFRVIYFRILLDATIQNQKQPDEHNDANEEADDENNSNDEKSQFVSPRLSHRKTVPKSTMIAINDFNLHMLAFIAVCQNEAMYVFS